MNRDELLSILKEDKKVLPGALEGNNREAFRCSFEGVFSCDEARNAKGVVYVRIGLGLVSIVLELGAPEVHIIIPCPWAAGSDNFRISLAGV